jgi:hypothetical protein
MFSDQVDAADNEQSTSKRITHPRSWKQLKTTSKQNSSRKFVGVPLKLKPPISKHTAIVINSANSILRKYRPTPVLHNYVM